MTRLVRTPYHTSGDFPELSAYYSLTPVALISGKVFLQNFASRSRILFGGKAGQKRLEHLSCSFGDCCFAN